jgi:hypothetical protein
MMMELKVILDFACCICNQPVNVTLKCEGKGLTARSRTVAAVNIPCPHCDCTNRLHFEPNGTVRDVIPGKVLNAFLEPSVN